MDAVDTTGDDRLFPVQGYGTDFETGRCQENRQVVLGLLCPSLVMFFFDEDGIYLGKEVRPWEYAAPSRNGVYQIYDTEFEAALTRQFNQWKAEMGFQADVIRIKPFFDADSSVGIQLLPDHYQDLETSEDFDDEDERQETIQERDQWLARGDFVWWWAKDYYMNSAGKVEST